MNAALSVRLEGAERELAAIASAQDAHDLADKAAAIAELAKRAKLGVSSVNHATVIRVLAEVRMAMLVDEGQQSGHVATRGGDPIVRTPDNGESTLPDLGIDRRRLAEARRLARDYTEDDIREEAQRKTAEDKQLSRDALLKSNAQRMQSSESNEWYTPGECIEAARTVLGGIDLDPASSEQANQTVRAARYYTKADDGLTQPWKGRVWLNPPYGGNAGAFIARLAGHAASGEVSSAVALVSSHSTDAAWFRARVTDRITAGQGTVPVSGR